MIRFAHWKLQTRLLTAILAVGSLIILAIGLSSYLTTRSALTQQAQAAATTLVERSALEIDTVFATSMRVPEVIAANEARTVAGPQRLANLNETLPLILGRYPALKNTYVYFEPQVIAGRDYAEVWYTRNEAAIEPFHSNLPGNPDYDSSSPIFEYRVEKWYTQTISATGTRWTEPYVDIASKEALISGTAPVRKNGVLIGVAGADFSLAQVQATVGKLHPTARSYAFLLNNQGTFMATPTWPDSVMKQTLRELSVNLNSPGLRALTDAMAGTTKGLIEILDPQSGETAWAAYQPVPSTGWSLVVIIPQQDLLQGAALLQRRVLLLGAGGLLLLALLAYLLTRSIVRPVRTLVTATERIAAGDLAARVASHSRDELGTLAA
ncbi:MAG TPA: cache domain-containing protein, partial [Herpetosiphonaceae bacterium]|nr:cache domain-containing protein [Herpetosiphonaceae bacterium]